MNRKSSRRRGRSRFLAAAVALSSILLMACSTGGAGGSSATPVPGSTGSNPTDPANVADTASAGQLDVTLYVEETGGVARVAEPVRSGVPVPRAVGLRSTENLEVAGPSGSLPSQIRVTSRWEGAPDDASKPIKWLLVDFVADVGKDGSSVYRLRTRNGATPTTGTLITENAADHVTVKTGAAEFTISKTHFNLFDKVVLADGTTVVTGDATSGAFLTTPGGDRLQASTGTASVAVEENGPLHAVIVARGVHGTPGSHLLDWTARLHFWKDRPDAEVVWIFTERELPNIRQSMTVDEMGLDLPISIGANPKFAIGGESTDATGALVSEASQRQTGAISPTLASTFNPGTSDTLTWANSGDAGGNGGKAPGWIDASGDSAGVTAATRWYWQLYPKKLIARPDRLIVDLWPKEDVDMRVYAGAQKSHEVMYAFHVAGTDAPASGRALVARLDHPLFARNNPAWYAGSRVWNRIGVADATAYRPDTIPVATAYFDHLLGVAMPQAFVDRPKTGAGAGHSYSMWDFGDGREEYWTNLAYDSPRSLLIHFGITGEREFLDRGLESAEHLRDVDIEHSPLDTRAGITAARGVTEPWLGRTRYTPSEGPHAHDLGYEGRTPYGFEHSKGQGIADHYFLTGDMESKDVLAETYHYFQQWKIDADSGFLRTDGTRVVSHMLLVLLGYYDAFGTAEARDRIDFAVRYLDDWQRRKTHNNPDGKSWMSAGDTTSMFMNSVTVEALMLYEVDFPNGLPVKQNIVDAAAWAMVPANGQLVHGSQGDYFNAWTGNNYGVTHSSVLDAMVGPWLAYASEATGNKSYVDEAKTVLLRSLSQNSNTPTLKAFAQRTRLVPAFMWFLETDQAKREPGA